MPNRVNPPRNLRVVDDTAEEALNGKPERAVEVVTIEDPPDLTDEELPVFRRIAAQMAAEGTWRPCYEHSLVTYCRLFIDMRTRGESFPATHLTQMRILAGDLGLTPSHFHRVART